MYLTPCTKIHSKLITGLNAKHKTTKFLEDGIGETSAWLGVWQWVLGYDKVLPIKEKTAKLHFIQIKSFCFLKDIVKFFKKQATE